MQTNQETNIETAFKALADVIANRMSRPLYLRIEMQDGQLEISQIEYLTPEELAQLAKVNARTVYGWIERGLLTFCKPVGTGQNLIPLRAALHWIEASATVKEPKKKKAGVDSAG
jgi:excisionase family DNA binding protein